MELQAAFVVQNSNYQDIHKYVSLAMSLGFDSIMLQKVTDWGKWTVNGVNYFFDHAVWQPDHANYPALVELLNDPIMSNPKVDLTNLSHLRTDEVPLELCRIVELKNAIPKQLTDHFVQIDHITESIHDNINELRPGNRKFDDDYVDMVRVLEQINEKVTFLRNITENLESKYNKEITLMTKEFYRQGYKIGGAEVLVKSDYLTERTRTMPMNEETATAVASAIGRYVSWEYPGLEIGPGDGLWTKHLVGCDPLYLVDTNKEFLTSSLEQFHEDYRRRVRTYTTEGTDLSMLPQNQFGFVLAWNVFNYLTADLLDLYLSEIIKVLRPGGYCVFSYNNAERTHSAALVQTGYMSYMPKAYLLKLLNKYGFEVIVTSDLEEHISWVEIKKPGELHTVKSHQAMAKIVHRA
jgi:SAM-dependent methyltransferase